MKATAFVAVQVCSVSTVCSYSRFPGRNAMHLFLCLIVWSEPLFILFVLMAITMRHGIMKAFIIDRRDFQQSLCSFSAHTATYCLIEFFVVVVVS